MKNVILLFAFTVLGCAVSSAQEVPIIKFKDTMQYHRAHKSNDHHFPTEYHLFWNTEQIMNEVRDDVDPSVFMLFFYYGPCKECKSVTVCKYSG